MKNNINIFIFIKTLNRSIINFIYILYIMFFEKLLSYYFIEIYYIFHRSNQKLQKNLIYQIYSFIDYLSFYSTQLEAKLPIS